MAFRAFRNIYMAASPLLVVRAIQFTIKNPQPKG